MRPVWEGALVVVFGLSFAVVASFYITGWKVVASSCVRPDQRVVLSVQGNMRYQLVSVLFNFVDVGGFNTSALNTDQQSFSSPSNCCMLYRHHTRTK